MSRNRQGGLDVDERESISVGSYPAQWLVQELMLLGLMVEGVAPVSVRVLKLILHVG